MGSIYTVEFEAAAIAALSGDYDLFEFTPADDRPIELVGLHLYVTSELGDAQDEWLRLRIIRGHTTSGGGTATTPRPVNPRAAAAGFTAETVGATIATLGTPINVWSGAMNVRAGFEMWFPDGCGPRADQADTTMVVRLMAAVADDVTMSGTAFVLEV